MLANTRGIILRNTKYGDTGMVVRVLTAHYGIRSFLIQGVRSGKGNIRPGMVLPLNLVEVIAWFKTGNGLLRAKEIRPEPVLYNIQSDIQKSCTAMFVLEVVNRALSEESENEELFDFLEQSILFIEHTEDHLSLFPQFFLLKFCKFLGFYPELESDQEQTLDLLEGTQVRDSGVSLPYTLENSENQLLQSIDRCAPDELARLKVSRNVRMGLLRKLITYYQLHITGANPFKSMEILQGILHTDGISIATEGV